MKKPLSMETPRSVMQRTVIETLTLRGDGASDETPIRLVAQYWSPEGNLLAEKDSVHEQWIWERTVATEKQP